MLPARTTGIAWTVGGSRVLGIGWIAGEEKCSYGRTPYLMNLLKAVGPFVSK